MFDQSLLAFGISSTLQISIYLTGVSLLVTTIVRGKIGPLQKPTMFLTSKEWPLIWIERLVLVYSLIIGPYRLV